jgi:hypothetical protein
MDDEPQAPRVGSLDFAILALDAAIDFLLVTWLVPAPPTVQCLLAGALAGAGAVAWFRWRDDLLGR